MEKTAQVINNLDFPFLSFVYINIWGIISQSVRGFSTAQCKELKTAINEMLKKKKPKPKKPQVALINASYRRLSSTVEHTIQLTFKRNLTRVLAP